MGRSRTFFQKNFLAYFLLILIAFSASGFIFMQQVNKYSLSQTQEKLRQTTDFIAKQTQYTLLEDVERETVNAAYAYNIYRANVEATAKQDGVIILVTNVNGQVLLWVDADKTLEKKNLNNIKISQEAEQQTRKYGYYTGMGTLGVFDTSCYTVGEQSIADETGDIVALVFVSLPTSKVTGLFQQILRTWFIILLITLVITLLMTYIISVRMTRPLKNMATAARSFAGGDFSVRVPVDSRCTEIDELAVSFNSMVGDLEQLEELTRGFIGNVSHEFKTPMTTIGGFVDGMLDGTIPIEQRDKYLHVISEEVQRLSRMVVRMLDAAKIQSGELILALGPFDISEMTSQIILSFEQKINKKHLQVDIELADRLIVMGDRDHIFRVVYNLVDNAVKFINDGGTLTLRAARDGEDWCVVSIKNTGDGISPEDIPHIFDKFYKTDRSRSRDRSGAGLGLYIVKNIINLHGGDISVRSDGGETEFSFNLPLAKPKKEKKHGEHPEESTQ